MVVGRYQKWGIVSPLLMMLQRGKTYFDRAQPQNLENGEKYKKINYFHDEKQSAFIESTNSKCSSL